MLEQVYCNARVLLATSEGEGFGLPLVEAAHYGLPIIARDIPVFREVAGKHAYYFSGENAQALADALGDWLRLGEAPSHLLQGSLGLRGSRAAGNCWMSRWVSAGTVTGMIRDGTFQSTRLPATHNMLHRFPRVRNDTKLLMLTMH